MSIKVGNSCSLVLPEGVNHNDSAPILLGRSLMLVSWRTTEEVLGITRYNNRTLHNRTLYTDKAGESYTEELSHYINLLNLKMVENFLGNACYRVK